MMIDVLKEYPLVVIIISFSTLALAVRFFLKAMHLKHALEIVERQYEPADKNIIEAGFKYYSGKQLERYTILLTRMRQQYGHDGLKVGHQALLIAVVSDSKQDVNTVKIPSFKGPN
jgi:hypothetical protein